MSRMKRLAPLALCALLFLAMSSAQSTCLALNCKNCTEGSSIRCATDGCDPYYFSLAGVCTPCPLHCSQCSGLLKCNEGACDAGYELKAGVCVSSTIVNACLAPNCRACAEGSNLQCAADGCDPYYFSLAGVCTPCPLHCSQCSGPLKCDEGACDAGYELKSGVCVSSNIANACLAPNCHTCEETPSVKCAADGCYPYFFNLAGVCTPCPLHCSRCSSFLQCDEGACDAGYELKAGVCVSSTIANACLAPNCHTCEGTPSVKCAADGCNPYFFNLAGVCSPCPLHCSQCSGFLHCDEGACDAGYELKSGVCVSSNLTNICLAPNCRACMNNSSLLCAANGCNDRYVNVLGVCTRCLPHCKSCSAGPLTCDEGACEEGYTLRAGACISSNIVSTCVAPNCHTCAEGTSLLCAQDGCNDRYVNVLGVCTSCVPHCKSCSAGPLTCDEGACDEGYALASSICIWETAPTLFPRPSGAARNGLLAGSVALAAALLLL